MTDLSVAIVGLGYGSTRCAIAAQTPGVRLTAVVDADESRAREHGRRYDVPWYRSHQELLAAESPDVVAIYTPSGAHRVVALDALDAGRHILLTKPIEVTLPRVDEIIDAAQAAGREVFSEFYLRYYPDNLRVKRSIDRGELGRLILGEFGFKCYRPSAYYEADGGWRTSVAMNGGGIVMNQALHAIDQMIWFMGEPATVTALSRTLNLDIPVEDTAVAMFTFESGAIATLVTTSTFRTTSGMDDVYGGGFTTRAELNGTDGSVSVIDNVLEMQKLDEGEISELGPAPSNVFVDIRNALMAGSGVSEALAVGGDGRPAVAVARASYASSQAMQTVELSTIREPQPQTTVVEP